MILRADECSEVSNDFKLTGKPPPSKREIVR